MKQFSPSEGLHIAYSHRSDGSFHSFESIKKFLVPVEPLQLSYIQLEHSDKIILASGLEESVYSGDCLLTNNLQHILSFVVADCFPVVLHDAQHHTFSLIHCGWKSLAKNLIALTIEEMHNTYGTNVSDIFAWIGPGICERHYTQTTKPAQLEQENWNTCIKIEHNLYSINLRQFITEELSRFNITRIQNEQVCTYEEKTDFFSHRRSTIEGDQEGRFFIAAWQGQQ